MTHYNLLKLKDPSDTDTLVPTLPPVRSVSAGM